MKVTKFWAKGYRSLRDVTLEPLGIFHLQLTRLGMDGQDLGLPFSDQTIRSIRYLLSVVLPGEFSHLGTIRTLGPDDEVVRQLFEAKNAPDRALRERFDNVRE